MIVLSLKVDVIMANDTRVITSTGMICQGLKQLIADTMRDCTEGPMPAVQVKVLPATSLPTEDK